MLESHVTFVEPLYVPSEDISGYCHAKATADNACEVFVSVKLPRRVFDMIDKQSIGGIDGNLKVIIAGNTAFLLDREGEGGIVSGIGQWIGIVICTVYILATVIASLWAAVILHQIWRKSGAKSYGERWDR